MPLVYDTLAGHTIKRKRTALGVAFPTEKGCCPLRMRPGPDDGDPSPGPPKTHSQACAGRRWRETSDAINKRWDFERFCAGAFHTFFFS